MIQIVLHRNLSLVIACSDGMQWVRGDTSHGWQDKTRKVRAVGRLEDGSNFNEAPNIAKIQRTLPFSTTHYRTTTFDTL
jgi:hypothetical protein